MVERKKRSLSPEPLNLDLKGSNFYLMSAQERLRNCTPVPKRQSYSPEPVFKVKKWADCNKAALSIVSPAATVQLKKELMNNIPGLIYT